MYQEVNLQGERTSVKSLTGRISVSGGTSDYNRLSNKPSINGVELSGNKTTSELGINIPDLTGYCKQTVTPAIGAGTTYDFTNFSDGAIIYVYRPSDQAQADYTGIFIRATNWSRLIPIKAVTNVSVNGYILSNNTSAALRCVVIST